MPEAPLTGGTSPRGHAVVTLLVIGAGLALLGLINVGIGRDKADEHARSLAAIEARADDPSTDVTARDLENARGKRAFYLGVQQAGWWLVAGGLALGGVGLTAAWLSERGAARAMARGVTAGPNRDHASTLR